MERRRGIELPGESISAGSRSVAKPWRRWMDIVMECLRKRGLNVRQARKMVQDRSEWQGFVMENACGVAWVMNP